MIVYTIKTKFIYYIVLYLLYLNVKTTDVIEYIILKNEYMYVNCLKIINKRRCFSMNDVKYIVMKLKHNFFQQQCNQEYRKLFRLTKPHFYLLRENVSLNDRCYYYGWDNPFIRNFITRREKNKIPKNY